MVKYQRSLHDRLNKWLDDTRIYQSRLGKIVEDMETIDDPEEKKLMSRLLLIFEEVGPILQELDAKQEERGTVVHEIIQGIGQAKEAAEVAEHENANLQMTINLMEIANTLDPDSVLDTLDNIRDSVLRDVFLSCELSLVQKYKGFIDERMNHETDQGLDQESD